MYRTLPRGVDLFADLKRLLPNFHPKTIVDVGANLGLWAEEAHLHFPTAKIHCFEPGPDTYRRLEKRFHGNPQVLCVNSAVGDVPGQLTFQIAEECDRSRIVSQDEAALLDNLTNVPTTTLDHYATDAPLDKIHLLKIDVEGYDLHVLRGAEQILSNGLAEIVYVEAGFLDPRDVQVPFFELHNELTQINYALFGFYEQMHEWKTKSPRLRRANAAYLNPQLTEKLHLR
jgi:FkbM family methyltransferase